MKEPLSQPHTAAETSGGASAAMEAAEMDELRARLSRSERTIIDLQHALGQAEDRERKLAHELQHRVRNVLAVIRSIYRRSRESGSSAEEFIDHFEGRLSAIARYHTAEIGLEPTGLDLESVVWDELLAVQCQDGPHLTVAGPPVRLEAKAAELMGLVVHELTTNSVKYGALQSKGNLTIVWSILERPQSGTLQFQWREHGVAPLTKAPRHIGFGRQLVEQTIPYELRGGTTFELKPGGLDCTIVLPEAVRTHKSSTSHGGLEDGDGLSARRPECDP